MMLKRISLFIGGCMILISCQKKETPCVKSNEIITYEVSDSLAKVLKWPNDLKISGFAGPDLVPSPACMAVAASGEVYVGVDMIGSLGKDMGKGYIKRLVDCDHDGIMDSHTQFAQVDNPRGILAMGKQVFVLHTTFSEETKKAENMDLVVFEDLDQDGIADGPSKPLIQNLSNPKYLRERGTDHATNGIQMGIDGWIYIAVGDFGFHNAVDRDGTKLTMLGGGVLRVRPDGTEMEVYTHGLRNIYDVAIDPYMNVFTRGNTNDGGGWNIRFAHQIQSGEYGYPILFKHFTEEILPALVDVGGGSGTGALYMNDHRWPSHYNDVPLMADWGRSHLYMHKVSPDKASFTQKEVPFIQLPQITDLDIDAAGVLYLTAWDGAGYSGSPDKGYVVRVTPQEFTYEATLDVGEDSSIKSLVNQLKSKNAKSRLEAQYELVRRGKAPKNVLQLAKDESQSLETRVASIFTYSQMAGKAGIGQLAELADDLLIKEFVLRALSDRLAFTEEVSVDIFTTALSATDDRIKASAIIGLGRLGKQEAVEHLLKLNVPTSFSSPSIGTEGPHATPNAEIILPHLAVKALVNLNPLDAMINALNGDHKEMALWTLRYLQESKSVEGLIKAYEQTTDEEFKRQILNNIARIYHKEAPYDATWWWGTRPDTHGPYYKRTDWDFTPLMRSFLIDEWKKSSLENKNFFTILNSKYKLGIDQFGSIDKAAPTEDAATVDLEKIKNKKGQVGNASIEDILIAMKKIKGDPVIGKKLFDSQACITCHSIKNDEVMKGPFMGQIGSIMNREQIAESILKPNASISQGFASVQIQTKDDNTYVGFISSESAEELTIRNIIGAATKLKISDIVLRKELASSMMPSGLVNALSYEELASLIAFLELQK